jgi:hypothetical protein
MEYWIIGKKEVCLSEFQYSNTPILHYSDYGCICRIFV